MYKPNGWCLCELVKGKSNLSGLLQVVGSIREPDKTGHQGPQSWLCVTHPSSSRIFRDLRRRRTAVYTAISRRLERMPNTSGTWDKTNRRLYGTSTLSSFESLRQKADNLRISPLHNDYICEDRFAMRSDSPQQTRARMSIKSQGDGSVQNIIQPQLSA